MGKRHKKHDHDVASDDGMPAVDPPETSVVEDSDDESTETAEKDFGEDDPTESDDSDFGC